jgi:phage terminase large subunit
MFYNTYKCVIRGEYIDPQDMISIDSDGVDNLQGLRSEACSVPLKDNNRGLMQILGKKEMKALGIDSPNVFESIMMSIFMPRIVDVSIPINFTSEFD